MGFSGFYPLVFDCLAPAPIRLFGVFGYGEKRESGEVEILKILILTRRGRADMLRSRTPARVRKPPVIPAFAGMTRRERPLRPGMS